MKKADQHKTPFTPLAINNGATQPTAPANTVRQLGQLGNTDPSSTYRSSRYPVPSFDNRIGAAQ